MFTDNTTPDTLFNQLYETKHPRKIKLVQIENGEVLEEFVKDFNIFKGNVTAIVDTGIIGKIGVFSEKLDDLEAEIHDIEVGLTNSLNNYTRDTNTQLLNITQSLNDFRKKSEPISESNLTEELKTKLADMQTKIDFLMSKHTEEPEEDAMIVNNRDGVAKRVRNQLFFIGSTLPYVEFDEMVGYTSEGNILNNAEFYGPNYADGIFNVPLIEVRNCGKVSEYLTESEIGENDTDKQLTIKIVNKLNLNEIDLVQNKYIPRKNIDSLTTYPEQDPNKSVSLNEEDGLLEFTEAGTTKYLYRVLRFYR